MAVSRILFPSVSGRAAPIYLSCRSRIPRRGATYPGSLDGPPDPLFSLAPDWVYRAPSITLGAVSSYLTFSPLPRDEPVAVCFLWHWPSCGPRAPHAPIFMGNPALWCPDFPLTCRSTQAGARQPVKGTSTPRGFLATQKTRAPGKLAVQIKDAATTVATDKSMAPPGLRLHFAGDL